MKENYQENFSLFVFTGVAAKCLLHKKNTCPFRAQGGFLQPLVVKMNITIMNSEETETDKRRRNLRHFSRYKTQERNTFRSDLEN